MDRREMNKSSIILGDLTFDKIKFEGTPIGLLKMVIKRGFFVLYEKSLLFIH